MVRCRPLKRFAPKRTRGRQHAHRIPVIHDRDICICAYYVQNPVAIQALKAGNKTTCILPGASVTVYGQVLLPFRQRDTIRSADECNLAFGHAVCMIDLEAVVRKAESRDVSLGSVPWWRWALVGVVMFSLVLTLATRTFHDTNSSLSTTVQSNSPQAMRQHMDRDAVRWAAPIATIAVAQAPTFYPRVAPAGPPLPTLLLEENLYNRPPPTC